MRRLGGKVVAITGAASGIGRALAVELVARGASTALADIDEAGLRGTVEILRGAAGKASMHVVDVSYRGSVEAFARAVVAQHGVVDMLINNAGVSSIAAFAEATYEDLEWVLGIDLWGVIYGVKTFLPLLRERPEAHIVNVASVNSYLPFPTNAPYNIAKSGVDALSRTLMQELAGTTVAVSCVYPGGVRTSASRHARHTSEAETHRWESMVGMAPVTAARRIIAGISRNKPRIIVGADARLLELATRLAPIGTARAINRAARRMTRVST